MERFEIPPVSCGEVVAVRHDVVRDDPAVISVSESLYGTFEVPITSCDIL